MRHDEDTVLEHALEIGPWPAGLVVTPEYFPEGNGPDARLLLAWAGKHYSLGVEIKPTVDRLAIADQIKQQLDDWGYLGKGLLVSAYLSPFITEHCRRIGLQFLDTAGNIYIDQPGLYINQEGKPRPATLPAKRAAGTTLAKVGFILLAYPQLATANYRELASHARVSLGSVSNAIKTLERAGVLAVAEGLLGQRLLLHRDKLLDYWVREYSAHLYPKRKTRRFTSLDPERFASAQLDHINLAPYNARWGAETAAARLTHYLRPGLHTIYVENGMTDLVKIERLRADPNGNVELVEMFWKESPNRHSDTVPLELIYADLIASGYSRNRDTAELIREKYLNDNNN